jgi:hypothetical protein
MRYPARLVAHRTETIGGSDRFSSICVDAS